MASSIVGGAVVNLISLLERDFSQIKGLKNNVEKLIQTLSSFQQVLEDADDRQTIDMQLADSLRKLRQAIYKANDMVDALSLKIQLPKGASSSSTNQVSCSLSPILYLKNLMFHRKIAKQFKKIIVAFEKMAIQKPQFQADTGSLLQYESQLNNTQLPQLISIYGRDGNKREIINILLNDFVNQETVSIFPIVGMGGIGKTFLTRSIYQDERIQGHFDVKFWVNVSDRFDLQMILKRIIESFVGNASDLDTLISIKSKVAEILREKRYLIVLDDVWNEDQDEWNELKSSLKGGAKGSSIILTTRSLTVASITGTVPPHSLGDLSDDECFSLFMNQALGDSGEEEHPNLVAIGRQIALKCKGIPLAAVSLGRLLRFKADERQWEAVRDSEIWGFNESGDDTVVAALRLSYKHLPSRLKQCFSYASLFQNNFKMQKTKLVYLWIANGFIQSHGNMELEDVGDDILKELLEMSFFQDATIDKYGNIESCKMHDLMHDLACSVVDDECLIANVGQIEHVPDTIRHLSVVCDSSQLTNDLDHLLSTQPFLHTLFLFNSIEAFSFQFSYTLRVLDLCEMGIVDLPHSVCDLKHLRYLDLSGNLLRSLPESIHKLRNLQMLDLGKNSEITALPLSVCELEHLRYLGTSECYMLSKMPVGIGKLRYLTTMAELVVETTSDGDSEGGLDISELQGLNQLRGGLKIKGLENVRNGEHAKKANLTSKIFLHGLQLIWESDNSVQVNNSTEVLEGLELPPNIQELEISNYQWEASFPERFLRNVKNLRSLEINFCRKLTSLPWELENLKALVSLTVSGCHELVSLPEGLLQKLISIETLKIWSCRSLKSLGAMGIQRGLSSNASSSSQLQSSLTKLEISDCTELILPENSFQHFNALRHLSLEDLPKLIALPQGIQHLSMLQNMEILRCSNMRMLPEWMRHLTALRSLEIIYCHEELHKRCERENGEDWPFISHIPHRVIR